jgi:hypothetical protein
MNGGMSAIGTKRTCDGDQSMSAFGGKADIARTLRLLVGHTLIFSSATTRPTAGRFSIRSLKAV